MAALDTHKLAAARVWATRQFPYLAVRAVFASTAVPAPGTGTVAVDEQWRMYVDPEVVAAWSVEELGAVLVHHAGHLLRGHANRAHAMSIDDETMQRWVSACDAEINDDLAEANVPLTADAVLPEALGCERGRFAEEYFEVVRLDQESSCPRDCGSGAHGRPREWDEDEDASSVSSYSAQLLRAQTANDVLSHLRDNGIGSVPGGWQRWAEQILAPKVDWRQVLAAELRRGIEATAGQVDYTYRQRSRRADAVPDVILPALQKPVPEVTIVCDTSGSMGDAMLAEVLAEVEGLLRAVGVRRQRMHVLAVDAAVHTVQRVTSARQVRLEGGGGTDMGAGIAAAVALRPRPAVVVVLTDGLTPWPSEEPRGVRVVVGLMRDPHGFVSPTAPPDWARVVLIEDKGAA